MPIGDGLRLADGRFILMLEWDAARLYAPDAEQFIRREYQKGWTLS
jgi:hypothetical protein